MRSVLGEMWEYERERRVRLIAFCLLLLVAAHFEPISPWWVLNGTFNGVLVWLIGVAVWWPAPD